MTATTVTVIQCICSVLTIIITMLSICSKYFKNMLTKADIEPIESKLNDLERKIDRQESAQSDMRERMAIVEYELGLHKHGGSL